MLAHRFQLTVGTHERSATKSAVGVTKTPIRKVWRCIEDEVVSPLRTPYEQGFEGLSMQPHYNYLFKEIKSKIKVLLNTHLWTSSYYSS